MKKVRQKRKKHFSFSLFVICLLVIFGFILYPRKQMKMITVDSDFINIRSGPGISYDIQNQVERGEKLRIVEKKDNWYQVKLPNNELGWVASWLILDNKIQANLTSNSVSSIQDDTKIRTAPSVDSDVIATLAVGETVTYLESMDSWYQVRTADGQIGYVASWVVEMQAPQTNISISEATILLDPGHGGEDPGASAYDEAFFEKEVTLNTALLVKQKLEQLGAHVIMTRETDQFISLTQIAQQSNEKEVDVFISFHFDSSLDSNNASGTTTYYYKEQDLALAKMINQELANHLPLQNRGIEFGDFQVLRENNQPALLLELGYINNKYDATFIQTHYYQEQIADAIVNALTNYFQP